MNNWSLTYRLQNSSPEYVIEWLQSEEAQSVLDLYSDENEIEAVLLARNNNLINLGLALYGQQPSTGQALYQNEDETISRAVLAGATLYAGLSDESWIIQDDVLPTLLNEWKVDHLETLLKNPHVPLKILESVFRRNEPFDLLDQDKWQRLIEYATVNEGFRSGRIGGWFEDFDELCNAAWSLMERLPVTRENAIFLKLMALRIPISDTEMDVISVINRWKSENEKVYAEVRQALVTLIPIHSDAFEQLKDDPDIALRKGYYAHKDFAFSEGHKPYYQKDGGDYLDAVIDNESVFYTFELRHELQRMCSEHDRKHDSIFTNMFEAKLKELLIKKPILFEFSDDDYPYHLLNDQHERLNIRAEKIDHKVSTILEFLRGTSESGSFAYRLFSQLDRVMETLLKQKRHQYAWLLVGLLAGYAFAKI